MDGSTATISVTDEDAPKLSPINRRVVLASAAAFSAAGLVSAQGDKPSIIFTIADDLDYAEVGATAARMS